MNPTSNKKDFDELSTALKDMAYSYIEKYSPSKQQLKVYLMKKVLIKFKTTKSKKEISELIDNVFKNNIDSWENTVQIHMKIISMCTYSI